LKGLKLKAEIEHQAIKIPDVNMDLQVSQYTEWLSTQARQNALSSSTQEMNDYAEQAGKSLLLGRRKIAVFAPFQPEYSAFQTITRWQTVALGMIVLVWVLGILIFREKMLIATMAAIIELYLGLILVNVVISVNAFLRSPEEQIDEPIIHALRDADWPSYTILCPLYRETKVVPQFVQAMRNLSYPTDNLQILLLLEEDDDETRDAIEALILPSYFKIVIVPEGSPRTKPKACNYGLMQATGQYIVIYDAEDIPDPLQLKKAVLTFANHGPEVACVQAKLNFYNPHQNLLTCLFTAEYSLWFDLILPGLQRMGFSIPLGGTSNHFQTRTLRTLGGWDAFNVTEDCDLGLRLHRFNLQTVVLNSITYEEANSQFRDWLRQRSRWVKGYMQSYLVHMRNPFRYLYSGSLGEFLSLQFMVGGKTAVLFLNPLLWLLVAMYFFLRPVLGDAYQTLFPKPLLYLGTLSLIFGNFFYYYLYLVACVRRKHYGLIRWALLVPFYWLMMSVAAFVALFQLIVKPHYWEKTEHGLHLRGNHLLPDIAFTQSLVDDPTVLIPPAISANGHHPGANGHNTISSIKTSLWGAMKLPLSIFSRSEQEESHWRKRFVTKDPWLIVMLMTACIASIAAWWYYFQHQDILLYGDAYGHLRIARAVLDGPSVSFAQIGGVWLPLQHVLMLPFIWNDYLWRTGLAGSIPAMVCYIVSCIYLYLAARRLTRNRCASYFGTLVFILNPNILYLQATPLSETVCNATSTMACYYILAWTQENHPKYLIFAAGSTFLATLARYDGWALFFVLLALIGWIGWMKHQKWNEIEGNLILFGVLGGLGIALWLLWDTVIFGDPLYFQHGPFSSQTQQLVFVQTDRLYTYHDLWQSLRYYTLASIDTLGPVLFGLAALSLVIFVARLRFSPEVFGTLTFLVPFGFYVLSLYTGQVMLLIPDAVPAHTNMHFYNGRYAAEMVAPAAIFVAVLISYWRLPALRRIWSVTGYGVVAIFIAVQSILVASGGIISMQDGQHGRSCARYHEINIYLAQHYTGGKILEYTFTSGIDGLDAGLDFKNIINEGSGKLWTAALHNPVAYVDWIIVHPLELKLPDESPDLVAQNIDRQSPVFIAQYTLVVQEPTGLQLYHRNGLPPLPSRPVPPGLLTQHSLCGNGGS
jgi:cellulose synthase/poly-beta-1,6-N-acetylglucosamine synthase-like glycosyltransferase